MKIVWFVFLAVFLSTGTIGCSHYSSKLPLKENTNSQMQKKVAVAGVLDRRVVNGAQPVVSAAATKLLIEEAKLSDVSERLKSEELSLLLSQPLELAVAAQKVRNIGQRLGQRYVVVGELGIYPVTERTIWDMVIVIPTPAIVAWFTIPIPISQQQGVMHETRVLRVIDLEQARIVSESYALLRDQNSGGEFTSSEIVDGLSNMKLAKE